MAQRPPLRHGEVAAILELPLEPQRGSGNEAADPGTATKVRRTRRGGTRRRLLRESRTRARTSSSAGPDTGDVTTLEEARVEALPPSSSPGQSAAAAARTGAAKRKPKPTAWKLCDAVKWPVAQRHTTVGSWDRDCASNRPAEDFQYYGGPAGPQVPHPFPPSRQSAATGAPGQRTSGAAPLAAASSRRPGTDSGATRKPRKLNPEKVFNHWQRHTPLKRRIFAHRKRVFDDLRGPRHAQEEAMGEEDEEVAPASSASSASTASSRVAARGRCIRMQALVERMAQHFALLDSAMKRKDFRDAQRHRRGIRHMKRALHRAAATRQAVAPRTPLPDPAAAGLEPRGPAAPAPYCSFYPSLALLRVGEHRLAHLVDRRMPWNGVSGRGPPFRPPQRLEPAELTQLREAVFALGQRDTYQAGDKAAEGMREVVVVPPASGSDRGGARRYIRDYVSNIVTDQLDDVCFTFLQRIYHIQSDLRKREPLHFKARMRYCSGLREVLRAIRSKRARLVIVAPDVEPQAGEPSAPEEGAMAAPGGPRRSVTRQGLDGAVREIMSLCKAHRIPLVACMDRRALSHALYARGSHISCVAVLSPEGAHDAFQALWRLGEHLSSLYAAEVEPLQLAAPR